MVHGLSKINSRTTILQLSKILQSQCVIACCPGVAMDADLVPSPLPLGARAIISGLKSREELNGSEVTVIAWLRDKGRCCVQLVASEQPGIQIKPGNLTRCPNAFANLHADLITVCLSVLSSWQDAARAAGVQRSWRASLMSGAWPHQASAYAPRHWKQPKAFGWNWGEFMPFARPANWAVPAVAPSWTWALHGMDGTQRVPTVLQWLDKMSESWPGILTTRWPGAKERLAWLTGEHDLNLLMSDLYGDIPREYPPGSGQIMNNGYRDGGYKPDAWEVARACTAPDMPADAALFFALAPAGFGSGASDGSFVQLFDGFEVSVAPYAPDAGHAERMRARQPQQDFGCDPFTTVRVVRDGLGKSSLLLCCDKSSTHYGKLLVVRSVYREGKAPTMTPTRSFEWTTLTFAQLLDLIFDSADETLASSPGCREEYEASSHSERVRVSGRGRWDLVWQTKHGAKQRLWDKIRAYAVAEPEEPAEPAATLEVS